MGVMSRPAGGIPAFTEHKHSKSSDLCMLILIYTNNDSNFIGGFAGSLKDRWTGLYPDPTGADNRLPLVKESFSQIIEMIMRSTMIVMTMSGS